MMAGAIDNSGIRFIISWFWTSCVRALCCEDGAVLAIGFFTVWVERIGETTYC